MRRTILLAVALLALVAAGGASAYALTHKILLSPGHCKTIHHTKVCARKVAPTTTTVTHTVTVAPSGIGETFTGNGDSTLAPLTLANGDEIHWTAQPDQFDDNLFDVCDLTFTVCFDNGSGATSGSTYVPAGTYTFDVGASGPWTISF